jgi:hypothetical protein
MALYPALKSELGGKHGKDAAAILYMRRHYFLEHILSDRQIVKGRGWQGFLPAVKARTASH